MTNPATGLLAPGRTLSLQIRQSLQQRDPCAQAHLPLSWVKIPLVPKQAMGKTQNISRKKQSEAGENISCENNKNVSTLESKTPVTTAAGPSPAITSLNVTDHQPTT